MAKFRIGDRVRVRRDLNTEDYYAMCDGAGSVHTNEEMLQTAKDNDYVLTIKSYTFTNKYYVEGSSWVWTDEMFEGLDIDETEKFRAFLAEVADKESNSYAHEFYILDDIIEHDSDSDCFDIDIKINELVKFYRMFRPKFVDTKEMTLAEIEEKLGYKIKLVED